MAPEQAMGQATDGRADLWAAGVVLYEMLSGRPLFLGPDLRSTISAVVSKEPAPISVIPSALDRVLRKALQKDPNLRYQSADEMIASLEAVRATTQPQPQAPSGSEDVTLPFVPVNPSLTVQQSGETSLRKTFPAKFRWLAAAALLVAAGVGLEFWHLHRPGGSASSGTRVATLPLLVVAADQGTNTISTQALADGLRSQLIDALAGRETANPGLLVIPAAQMTSQHVAGPEDARKALGANLAITGSLSASGTNLRAVLSSVDTETSKVLKSESIDGSATALPEFSKKLSDAAAEMLGLKSAGSSAIADPAASLAPADESTYLASLGYLGHWDKSASLDAAINGFERVVKSSPNFAPGYAALADCYQRRYMSTKDTHALESADQNASQGMKLHPDMPNVALSFGEVRLLEGKFSEAVNTFERVLATDDRNDRAYRGLAKAYAAMGLPDKAEETWQKAVVLRPNSVDGHNQLALFEMSRGNYSRAAAEFRSAQSLAPGNVNIMSNLGVALLYAGSLDESRKVLQESIRLAPTYASYTNLGNLDLKQGRYADAAADYEKALEINKTDYRVWSNLAVAYSRSPGQKERAKDGFLQAAKLCREALKDNPNDPGTLSDLAMFVASEGNERQEPLVLIEKALALAPQDTYVQFNAAETYESLGYRNQALDWIAKLVAAGYPLDDINESPVLSDLIQDKRYQAIAQARKK
jgi:tetratricopeptide (TPR) repeat protein